MVTVRTGSINKNSGDWYDVRAIKLHGNYRGPYKYDVAVVGTFDEIRFSQTDWIGIEATRKWKMHCFWLGTYRCMLTCLDVIWVEILKRNSFTRNQGKVQAQTFYNIV